LGKLPEIPRSQRGTPRNKFSKYVRSIRDSDDSTTAFTVSNKPVVIEVDAESKKEKIDDDDYWGWQAKELEYLKLPVFHPVPK